MNYSKILKIILVPLSTVLMLAVASAFTPVIDKTAPAAEETYSLSGVVLDAEQETPVSGATVMVHGTETMVQTGDNGTFYFEDLEAGEHTLVVDAEGYDRAITDIELTADVTDFEIELDSAYVEIE